MVLLYESIRVSGRRILWGVAAASVGYESYKEVRRRDEDEPNADYC